MATKKKYDSTDITTLRFPDNIIANPGMYIGGTDASALWVIVREMLDNAIDEHLAGRGTSVTLFADNGTFWVSDDANGIPQGIKTHSMVINGKKTTIKTPTMQAIFGELHTSGKFEADAAYAASRGTHGVGVKATNALSDSMEVWTFFEGSWYYIAFKNGHLATEVTKLKSAPKKWDGTKAEKGTLIKVLPNYKVFSAKSFPSSVATQWAELAAYLTPGFRVAIGNAKGMKEFFSKRGPVEYIEKTLTELKCEGERDMFEYKSALADVIVAFTNAEGYQVKGYTNGLHQSSGGKHVDAVSGALYTALKPWIKTKKIKVDGKPKEVPAFREPDLKDGMVGLVNMYLSKATFTSQDKAKLADDRAGEPFEAMLVAAATKFFNGNKALAQRIADRASRVSELKTKFVMSKKAATDLNKIKRQGLPAKYASYDLKTKVEHRELFLLEGDSAAGKVREARFPYQAILPLRGKVLNALRQPEKALESEEILNILAAIGYDVNAADPMTKLQVGKIICLADPDPDGPFVGETMITVRRQDDGDLGAEPHQVSIESLSRNPNGFEVPVFHHGREIWAPATASLVRNVTKLVAIEAHGTKYRVSEDHKFVVIRTQANRGRELLPFPGNADLAFCRARDMRIGDRLYYPYNDKLDKRDWNKQDKSTGLGFVAVSKLRVQEQAEPVPVYCLTVPKYHHFMLPSGIMSANCHINSLLLALMYKFLPGLFERGMVYVANAPEFYAEAKGELFVGATLGEVQRKLAAKGIKNVDVRHVKGYGEMNEGLIRTLIMDPDTRHMIKIKPLGDADHVDFVKLMADDVDYRRQMLGLPSDSAADEDEAPAKPAVKKVAVKKEAATAKPAAKKVASKKAK
ncbi:GyrB-like type IIA DNA topoisomerase [Burkholderia phage BcepSaruman]|uniref:DNA topoisomerase (ATP-hydrolyzing) n=1 Tax=Burkholderia phage BcepSaruman TaxID=2530032 RepID=A0A4D5ZC38_9CAUD|nr:GyrB-like type IIA DNA topoisomerase [Burkholderia phage BcepSaruman]QBX06583.1 GyrB-like type IIA DNA topoisomerase [Burkholderia phage BcepSaruman]